MNELAHTAADALIVEVTRYLAVVDVFRGHDCEPTWLPELWPGRERVARPVRQLEPDRLRGPT